MNKINLSEYRAFIKQKQKFEQVVWDYLVANDQTIDKPAIDFQETSVLWYSEWDGEWLEIDPLKLTGKT